MALTSTGVEQARQVFSQITNEIPKFEEVKDVISFMNSSEEFSKFISGTKFGSESYEKWNKLLKLVSSDLYQAMVNLSSATNLFLERQEQYNSSMVYGSGSTSGIGGTISGTFEGSTPITGVPGPGISVGKNTSSVINRQSVGTASKAYVVPDSKTGERKYILKY